MRVLILVLIIALVSGSDANSLHTKKQKKSDKRIFLNADAVSAASSTDPQVISSATDPTVLIELLEPLQLLEESTTPIVDMTTPIVDMTTPIVDVTTSYDFVSSKALQFSSRALQLPTGQMALMPQMPTGQMAQIQSLDVDCSKDSMVVRMRFDAAFNGLIYSKGFHSNLDCHYVRYNSGRDFYEFIIRLDSCGSKWVDELSIGGQAYLENVIIIQNEPGIQEIWDTSRAIRCFWESSLQKAVTYALNIDMLDTQVVSFSGDSLTASLDIQLGKGPLAPSVDGLVKIGDTLTMVVAIDGNDADFDVQVQNCVAHDGDRGNSVSLTDARGCVLKKKLMGPWQKSRQGSGLVAFSFFQAFKFPDSMNVFLECDVELCKGGCDVCPDDNPLLIDVRGAVARNRRHTSRNASDVTDFRLSRSLRVVSNEDIGYKPDSRSTVTLTTGE